LREGVVVVREMSITFANIQNVAISQGSTQRVLDITDLRVVTAGDWPKRHPPPMVQPEVGPIVEVQLPG